MVRYSVPESGQVGKWASYWELLLSFSACHITPTENVYLVLTHCILGNFSCYLSSADFF